MENYKNKKIFSFVIYMARNYRKRSSRPKAWYNKKYSVMNLASKAWQGVKYIKSIINSEKKFFDTTNNTTFDYNGGIFSISAVPQGDTPSTRNGNSILLKSLGIRYTIGASTTPAHTSARVIFFQDTMSLGTIPAVSDVLSTVGSALGVNSQLNLTTAQQGRFKILYDRIHTMSNNGKSQVIARKYIKCHNHVKYTGPLGTDEGRNMIYCLVISDLVTSNLPTLNIVTRVGYYDN